jgi:chorismate synthase
VQELVQAQARTEQRVGGLEQAMQELAQAQARTEQQMERPAQQVGGLSDSIGYGLEDIAKVVLPGYLQRHFGIRLEGKLGDHFFHIDGSDVEINPSAEEVARERDILLVASY